MRRVSQVGRQQHTQNTQRARLKREEVQMRRMSGTIGLLEANWGCKAGVVTYIANGGGNGGGGLRQHAVA